MGSSFGITVLFTPLLFLLLLHLHLAEAFSDISFYSTTTCNDTSEIIDARFSGSLLLDLNATKCHAISSDDNVYALNPTQLDPGCIINAFLDTSCVQTARLSIALNTCNSLAPQRTDSLIGSWNAHCPDSGTSSATPGVATNTASAATPSSTESTVAAAGPEQQQKKEWLGLNTTQMAILAAGLGFSLCASMVLICCDPARRRHRSLSASVAAAKLEG